MDSITNNVIPIIAVIVSIYTIVKKDNSKLGSMETKIDMLLLNSNETKNDVKEHSKQLAQHETEIKNVKHDVSYLQDTLRIRKIKEEEYK
jgi:septal ring factor EnvC (AmiA/AmiB activator)